MFTLYRSKKSVLKKVFSLVLCICLLASSFPLMTVYADEISSTENKLAELEQEKKELDSKLSDLKDDEQNAVAYQEALQEKITIVEEQITATRQEIERLDKAIVTLEKKIAASEEEMSSTIDTFYQTLTALYKSGSTTQIGSIEILLNSSSLAEYSMKTEAMKSVTMRNDQVMDKIQKYLDETEAERTECQKSKEELATRKKELDASYEELDGLYAENAVALQNIIDAKMAVEHAMSENEEESAGLMSYLEGLIAQRAAQEEAARQAAQEAGNSGGDGAPSPGTIFPDSGSSQFTWPIPGVYYISQHYGNNGHRGIDIAGPYGTAIVAAEEGEVITANNYDSWGDSWGFYVLIYHNSTYTTRYAHLSSLAVSNGQYVSKGQVIGYEGSTGNSTGPHLHFEVYENGSRIDPYPFIS